MNPVKVLPAILLVAGLLAGFFSGSVLNPVTVTSTTMETVTETKSVTITQPVTVTSYETLQRSTTFFVTMRTTLTSATTSVSTVKTTATITTTSTTTMLSTVYPAASGTILVRDRGNGDKDTPPFTLEAASDLKIKITISARADLRYVGLSWYLHKVGETVSYKMGEIDEEQGVFEFYAAAIPRGNWYIRVISANCNWEITVEKVT
ncbi:MAG: hypothetical protein QXD24_01970 [Candidatus Caldarchaeum sp.]